MACTTDRITDEASKIVSDGNLHQCLWLPQTSSHERLRVTFSTTTNFSDTSLPTLLACGPMFSTRWITLDINRFAVDTGVRVISVDRPGMGGSTRVPLKLRVQVWLETVPVLLEKLNVDHVGLACHSAGIIFALNTLYCLRDILDPRAPYVACVAPWVNNERPHTALMKIASSVPNSAFDYWHSVIKVVARNINPAVMWSGGVVSSVLERPNSDSLTLAKKYGMSEELAKEVDRLKMMYILQEDITGADEDARLCLRKEGPGNWGVCEDYAEFVRSLVKLEQDRETSRPDQDQNRTRTRTRLEVHAYFASSDIMIGKQGQDYFEKCWRQPGVDTAVSFETRVLDGTTHDGVAIDPDKGVLKGVFAYYAAAIAAAAATARGTAAIENVT